MSASSICDIERIGSIIARSRRRRGRGLLVRNHGEAPDGGFVDAGRTGLRGSRWRTAS